MVNYDIYARDLIEQQILSSIMNLSMYNTIDTVKDLIMNVHGIDTQEYFASSMNQSVFIAILRCWENEVQADLAMVCTFKPKDIISANGNIHLNGINENDSIYNLGEDYKHFDQYVIDISTKWLSSEHLEKTIFIHKQFLLIDYWNSKAKDVLYNEWDQRDILDVTSNIIDGHNLLFDKITKHFKKDNSLVTIKDRAQKEREMILSGNKIWIPTGIPPIDEKWKGWWDTELSIIAARPSMGKTALMLASASYAAFEEQKEGAFFSLEMDKKRLLDHLIAAKSGIPYSKIKNYSTTEEEFKIIMQWYDYFENESLLKIYDFHEIRTLQDIVDRIGNMKYAFVDYIQLVKINSKINKNTSNREQDVSEIARTLKLTAGINQIPIIAGAQLNRNVDNRPGHRPVLSDLRESGAIEQDADNVLFPFRPAYYEEVANPDAIIPFWQKGNFDLRVAKGRDVGTDNVKFNLDLLTYKFTDGHLFAPP